MRVLISTDAAPEIDLGVAASTFTAYPGRVVVEMYPNREEVGGIVLVDRQRKLLRPQMGVVLSAFARTVSKWIDGKRVAVRERMDIEVGDVVIVHPEDGKHVSNFRFGRYQPGHVEMPDGTKKYNQVRFYGVTAPYHEQALSMPWDESVLGKMMNGELKAVGRNVLLKLSKINETTQGGVHIPDGHKTREHIATVVSAGGSCVSAIPGQRVVYNRNSCKPVKFGHEDDLAFIDEDGIFCALTE